MAKSAISSADLALLRSQQHSISDVRLNIFAPEVVATAQVSSTPTDNPASSLTVTGDVSATEVGQRIIIRDGSSNIVNHGTLRKATSGQTLYIAPVSIGDSGYVSPIKRAITSGDSITVYADRPLFGDYSRISNGTFRKTWDVPYTDQNGDCPPIANAGTSQSARISVGGSADFTLPRLGTNDSIVFGSKTISSYLWALPTGVTLKAGYATSDDVIEVTATQGQHIIKLTVTDSNAKTHTAYTYLFVSDGLNYQDLMERFSVTIESDTQDLNGRSISFTVKGTGIDSALPPASYIHLQHDSLYNGSSLTVGVDVDVFVGYITEYRPVFNGDYGTVSITAVSPYIYLQKVFMPPQLITEVSNPNNWTQVNSTLSNPQGALQYIRWQCQNLFSMHDIDAGNLTTPRKYSYEYNGKTVASGLDVSASAVAGNVGSASDGTIVLRKNPVHENNTFRNALASSMTISADDINAPLEQTVTVNVPYADIRAGAFAYNGGGASGVKAWYGVKRWSQGGSETVLPDFTVDKTNGLDNVLEKVGHIAANEQYPDIQPVSFNGNINIIDPAYIVWQTLNISSDYDPMGLGWSNIRHWAQRVNRNWDNDNMRLSTSAQLKRETFGQKADQWIPGSAQTVVSGGWVANLPIAYSPTTNDFSVLPNVAMVYNTDGDLAITQNFTDTTPQWESLNDYVTGNICDVCYDYNSAFFTSGYVLTQPLSVYIASISGTTLYVYRLYDIKASTFEVTELATYTMSDTSCTTEARIQCSSTTGTLAVVAWHDQTGVEFGRTTDGGNTWSSKANVGDAITDTTNDNAPIGLYISGVNQVITAPNSSNEYGTYLCTTVDGSFSKLANSEDNTAPNPMITGDGGTTLYVATDNDGSGSGGLTPTHTIDFDGGYSSYTITGSVANSPATTGDTFGGNGGGNAAGGTEGSTGFGSAGSTQITINVTFTSPIDIDHIDMDVYFDPDWNSFSAFTYDITIEVVDKGNSPVVSTNTLTVGTYTSSGSGEFINYTNIGGWQTVSPTFVSVRNTDEVDIKMSAGGNWTVNSVTTGVFRIDNIKFYSTSTGTVIDPALYKVTTYTATDAWTDATPDTDYIPQLPYGLGVDVADTDNIELAATDESTPKYFDSSDTASNWTDNGASDYRAIKRLDSSIIYGGVDALDLSVDSGATVIDKTGNLSVAWGDIGTIKNILVLI